MIENVNLIHILYKRVEKEAQRVPLAYIELNLSIKKKGLLRNLLLLMGGHRFNGGF